MRSPSGEDRHYANDFPVNKKPTWHETKDALKEFFTSTQIALTNRQAGIERFLTIIAKLPKNKVADSFKKIIIVEKSMKPRRDEKAMSPWV